jgi:AraC-like DNA-binding protein
MRSQMTMRRRAPEIVRYRRSPDVPGVEILDVENSARQWRFYCGHFGITVPEDWASDVRYAGRGYALAADALLFAQPGEVFSTQRIHAPGTVRTIMFDPSVFCAHVEERSTRSHRAAWKHAVHAMSPQLGRRIVRVFRLVGSNAPALRVQSAVTELVDGLVVELLDEPPPPVRAIDATTSAVDRVRECLHDAETWVDLETLARSSGLSRFQVLRGFKKRYGVSPHVYQVGRRLAKGHRLLRDGISPAQVAAECGFADQSHFTRWCKRVFGITPGALAAND